MDCRVLSGGIGCAVLRHALMRRLSSFPNLQVCAFLATLDHLHYIVQLASGSSVLEVDKLGRFDCARGH